MPDERVVSGTRNPARRGCRHLEGLIGVLEGGPEPSGLCALVGIAEERPHGCGAKVERIHVRVGSGNRRIVKRRPLKLSGRGRQLEPTSLNSCFRPAVRARLSRPDVRFARTIGRPGG